MNKSDLENGLKEFITELRYSEKAGNTLKKYQGNIDRFIRYLDSDVEITKELTLTYKQNLIDCRFKTSTINSHIIAVNKYLKWLGRKDLIVKQIKQQHKSSLEEVLSPGDFKRLLRFARSMGRDDIYLIMKILAMTAIRISELSYFTVDNTKSNYILVKNKGKERNIVIRQDLARELRKYAREKHLKTGYLFPGKVKDKMMAQSTIWRNMQRIGGAARVKKSKIHAHSFRHLFAKQFLADGNDITELADILGHNDLKTTRIYTRTTDEEKRAKMEKMKFKL